MYPYFRLREKLSRKVISKTKRSIRQKQIRSVLYSASGNTAAVKNENSRQKIYIAPQKKKKNLHKKSYRRPRTEKRERFGELDRLYGFRCLVTIIDRKSCVGQECKGTIHKLR